MACSESLACRACHAYQALLLPPCVQMSVYIEACESGSLFQGMLEVRAMGFAQSV